MWLFIHDVVQCTLYRSYYSIANRFAPVVQAKLKQVADQLRAAEKATAAAAEKKDAKQLRLAAANAEHDKARKRVDMPAPMPAVKVGTVLQHPQKIASQLPLNHCTHSSQC